MLLARFPYAVWVGSGPNRIGMSLWCLTVALLALAAVRDRDWRPLTHRLLSVAALSFVVAAGTFNDLLEQLTVTLFFTLFALLALLSYAGGQAGIAAGFVLALGSLLWGTYRPYGLPAHLLAQDRKLDSGPAAGVRVDQETLAHVVRLRRIGQENGVRADTPVVDLTGGGPGTALALGGKAPVLPWILHVTPHLADVVWDRMSEEERRRAWIVGPIADPFRGSRLAAMLLTRRAAYRCIGETRMTFWGREREIVVFIPAAAPLQRSPDRWNPCPFRSLADKAIDRPAAPAR
jgi:hypothetical protein